MSEHLSKVPMVVTHPGIQRDRIEREVSLKDLFGLFLESARERAIKLDPLFTEDVTLCEYPALGDEQMYETHPEVSDDAIAQRVAQDSVSAHSDGWHVVANSDDDRIVEHDGAKREIEQAPETLLDSVEQSLFELSQLERRSMNEETVSQLEDLGYV
jgi:delta-aminolevulinic acid dehydratase/porphobilinogen synthase